MSLKLIVAGGGIGGMAAALALRRAGLEATVFERAPAFGEVGAGVSLWPNATRVLASLGVLDQIAAQGAAVARFNLLRPDGSQISTIPMTGYATPAFCVHRADLHRALYAFLPAESLETGQAIESFREEGGGVIMRLAKGREVRADGLIGADGINSVIRGQLHGPVPAVYRGYRIWRGLAPDPGGLSHGHISETWGAGRRFGIMPIGQGRVCWYATHNRPAAHPDAPAARQADVRELFRGWHDPIPALIEATTSAEIVKTDARDRPPLRHWGRGGVTLLGDAAHPITPNVGQGACLAIEDAACLAKLLPGAASVAAGFQAYEQARSARTAYIARQARRIGVIGQWQNPWLVRGRDLVARLILARTPARQLNAIYDHEV